MRVARALRGRLAAAAAWVREIWRRLQRWQRAWITNIVVGVAVAIVLALFEHTAPLAALQNLAMDRAMLAKATITYERDARVPPLAFIDIDERTWRSKLWGNGEPYRTPRRQLVTLIDYALDRGAKYVVVDVVIEGEPDAEDLDFQSQIAARAKRLAVNGAPNQYLLFVRSLRLPIGPSARSVPTWRPSVLDPVIDGAAGRVIAVSPYFLRSADGVVREWKLWNVGCKQSADGARRWAVLPSVQLAIHLLATARQPDIAPPSQPDQPPCQAENDGVEPAWRGEAATATIEQIDSRLWRQVQDKNSAERPSADQEQAPIDLRNRILFTLPYPPSDERAGHLSAFDVLSPRGNRHANERDFGDGVVVIGPSFDAARDTFPTPLAFDMPGSWLILNGVASMFAPGLLREPPAWAQLLIELVLILVVGLWFAVFEHWLATLAFTVILMISLLGPNYLLSSHGIWLDYALPVVAIALHRVWELLYHTISGWIHGQPPKSEGHSG